MKYPHLPFELNRTRKLSDEDIKNINKEYGEGSSQRRLSEKYKVGRSTIRYHISEDRKLKSKESSKKSSKKWKENNPEKASEYNRKQMEYMRKVNPQYVKYCKKQNEKYRNEKNRSLPKP